jgi:hypothetical protein
LHWRANLVSAGASPKPTFHTTQLMSQGVALVNPVASSKPFNSAPHPREFGFVFVTSCFAEISEISAQKHIGSRIFRVIA